MKITKAYLQSYDGHTVAHVEWINSQGRAGRSEGEPANPQMLALLRQADRAGVKIEREKW
jgi:hypothetical protein